MPLTRGAASKTILADLTSRPLRRLCKADPDGRKAEDFGGSWEEFKREIRKLRKVEALATVGELDPGMISLSTAVFDTDGDILGSIGVVAAEYRDDEARIAAVKRAVAEAGAAVTRGQREGRARPQVARSEPARSDRDTL